MEMEKRLKNGIRHTRRFSQGNEYRAVNCAGNYKHTSQRGDRRIVNKRRELKEREFKELEWREWERRNSVRLNKRTQ